MKTARMGANFKNSITLLNGENRTKRKSVNVTNINCFLKFKSPNLHVLLNVKKK